MDRARGITGDPMRICADVYESALADDTARSLQLASAAIQGGNLSAYDLRRDPGLSLLIDHEQIEGLAA